MGVWLSLLYGTALRFLGGYTAIPVVLLLALMVLEDALGWLYLLSADQGEYIIQLRLFSLCCTTTAWKESFLVLLLVVSPGLACA